MFCSDPGAPAGSFASQLPVAAETLLDFCRGSLYECITREKAAALLPYIMLWCMMKVRVELQKGMRSIKTTPLLWHGQLNISEN